MLHPEKGVITHVGNIETYQSGFRKRVVAIKVDSQQYQNIWGIEFLKDDSDLISPNDVGKEIEFDYEICGNEHKGRIFINLVCKKFSFGGAASPAPAPKTPKATKVDASNETTNQPIRDEDDSDLSELPF